MRVRGLRLRFLFFYVVILLFFSRGTEAVTLYVSSSGNDTWSGWPAQPNKERTDGPLASLVGARDAIRRLKSQGLIDSPVSVIVLDGTYTLTEPFILTPQDSGTEECPISYEAAAGARPVFTGGRVITGFKPGENGLWQTYIAEVAAGRWYFEQLFVNPVRDPKIGTSLNGTIEKVSNGVNGRRAVRARTPNKFYHYTGTTSEVPVNGSEDQYRRTTSVSPDVLAPLQNLDSREIRDVTLVAYHKWCITRRYLTEIDAAASTIITVGEKLKTYSDWPENTRFHLENFKAALDAPGEWFLHRDGTL
jgi:hypothetical protein